MLAALKLTFSPSIWPASCLAMSTQGSACAGAAAKAGRERDQRGGQGGADAQRQASAQRCCHEIPPRYENTRSYMQAPAERVNTACAVRMGTCRPAPWRRRRRPALAVIAVGLAVAAARPACRSCCRSSAGTRRLPVWSARPHCPGLNWQNWPPRLHCRPAMPPHALPSRAASAPARSAINKASAANRRRKALIS